MELLIYEVRNRKGITLRELEKLTGISRSTLCRYEKIDNDRADIYKIEKIAKALKCEFTDLYQTD